MKRDRVLIMVLLATVLFGGFVMYEERNGYASDYIFFKFMDDPGNVYYVHGRTAAQLIETEQMYKNAGISLPAGKRPSRAFAK
ncbi:MAG: hypothetical protein IK083_02720 [Abditibacteriota bacterium]|nr:hypothetical protein [Abditibacteriota bacterium]